MPTSITNPAQPETYPRRILVAVTGLSPPVVTETLYYLTRIRSPAYIPTEVHLLTTGKGAAGAELTLLDEEQGQFWRFCRDYGFNGQIRFGRDQIHVITDDNGQTLMDITTEEESRAVGDSITERIREFADLPDCSLHVSIAGGRKTMGFYAGYALSLFGRPQDRLSHVLVSEPFETIEGFFYPPPKSTVLYTRDERRVRSEDARIMLAEIPFVRLRDGVPKQLGRRRARFGEVVEATQRNLLPTQVVLVPARCVIRFGEIEVRLEPRHFAFYAWLAERRLANAPPLRSDQAEVEAYRAVYAGVLSASGRDVFAIDEACERFDGRTLLERNFIHETSSRINQKLEDALGHLARQVHGILVSGERGESEYSLAVPADRIGWEE